MNLNEIQPKEDSLEKLQEVQGRPTKFFIFAPEFNAVLNAVKNLFNSRQNSLAPDGTGTKYPTVDAVNQALEDFELGSGLEIATQAENESAASSTDLNLPNVTNSKASTPRGLRWFWNTVRSINWDWSGRPNFWASIRFGGLTAGHWLRLNANKDVEGFDGVALLNGKVDKADLTITVANPPPVIDGTWDNRFVVMNNSGNRTLVITTAITTTGLKTSGDTITFQSAVGRTLVAVNGTAVMNGSEGQTFSIKSVGTKDYVYVS